MAIFAESPLGNLAAPSSRPARDYQERGEAMFSLCSTPLISFALADTSTRSSVVGGHENEDQHCDSWVNIPSESGRSNV